MWSPTSWWGPWVVLHSGRAQYLPPPAVLVVGGLGWGRCRWDCLVVGVHEVVGFGIPLPSPTSTPHGRGLAGRMLRAPKAGGW